MAVTGTAACVLCLCCLLLLDLSHAKTRDQASGRQGNRRPGRQRTPSAGSSRSPRCKDKTTFTFSASDLRRKTFTFKCPKGPVAEADAVGVKGSCRGYSPYLVMSANRCSWNATCTIPYKGKALETEAAGNNNKSCMGQVPDKLEISYTCLKKKAEVTDVLGQFKKTKKRLGILRSHRLFPWTYRNGDQLGNVTLIRPRKPTGLSTLWITVRSLAILDSDLVFLSWRDNSNRGLNVDSLRVISANDTTFKLPNLDSAILTFYADYEQHHTRIGGEEKGFILCFQWLKAAGKPRKGSVCNRVMVPAKCKTKKGSGRRGSRGPRTQSSRGPRTQSSRGPRTQSSRGPRTQSSRNSRQGRQGRNGQQ